LSNMRLGRDEGRAGLHATACTNRYGTQAEYSTTAAAGRNMPMSAGLRTEVPVQRRQRPANEPAPAEQLHEAADEAAIVNMPKATGTAQMVSSR
jgi:hypothetical protein